MNKGADRLLCSIQLHASVFVAAPLPVIALRIESRFDELRHDKVRIKHLRVMNLPQHRMICGIGRQIFSPRTPSIHNKSLNEKICRVILISKLTIFVNNRFPKFLPVARHSLCHTHNIEGASQRYEGLDFESSSCAQFSSLCLRHP